MPAQIATVIVTYDSAHVINGLLDSLPAALDGLKADVVVVDNSSRDETREVVSARSDCRLVVSPNLGYAAGINRGVAALGDSSAPILVLNPDVRLAPGSVRSMHAALDRPGIGIVAPRVVDDSGHLVLSQRREPTLSRALGLGGLGRQTLSEYVTDPAAYERSQTVDWALGAVMLVARECHVELGGWDESFFLYSEETDFCLRARDAGWATWYDAEALAVHIGGQSGFNDRVHAMQIVNRVRLYRRRHGLLASLAYQFLSVASEASWLARGHRQSIASIKALLQPRHRPSELGCSKDFVPR